MRVAHLALKEQKDRLIETKNSKENEVAQLISIANILILEVETLENDNAYLKTELLKLKPVNM